MFFHVFSKFRRNLFFFEKSSGGRFWIRGFVDVSDCILLVWLSIDSLYIYIFSFVWGKLRKLINSYISPINPKEGNREQQIGIARGYSESSLRLQSFAQATTLRCDYRSSLRLQVPQHIVQTTQVAPPDLGTTYGNAAEQMHRARTGKGEGDKKHRFWFLGDVWDSYRRLWGFS